MKIIMFLLIMIITSKGFSQKNEFDATITLITDTVSTYSIPFDNASTLKIKSITIAENGQVILIYNDKITKNVTFNLNSLKPILFENDFGKCSCGITLHENTITFWVDDKTGISLRVTKQKSKILYDAFVSLISLPN